MTFPSSDHDERDTREWTIGTVPGTFEQHVWGPIVTGPVLIVVPASERVRADRAEKERDELREALRVAADRLVHGPLLGNEHWWTLAGPLLSRLEAVDKTDA